MSLSLHDYEHMLMNPQQTADLPHDACLGWTIEEKAQYLKNLTDCANDKGISVHFTDRYYPTPDDAQRKKWELATDDFGRQYRPIPVGELDLENNIYLNIKDIGYVSSFFTLMHLYGHRVQHEIMTKRPDSPDGQHYAQITKYVGWPKPLNMADVFTDYRINSGKPNADYEEDFLAFEKEAFAFGLDLLQDAHVPIDDRLQYAINTYIVTDFEEIKSWWESSPIKSGDDFNERYQQLYTAYQADADFITQHYPAIPVKAAPFSLFEITDTGVIVVRNNVDAPKY